MTKENGKPQIRFAKFKDTWEQRKLGDMGTTFTGLSGKTKEDFGHGDAKFITYMNVFSNPVADLKMTESVEIDTKQNCVKAGDVFFTTSSETPEEVGMSCVMPENADNVYLNSFCFGYRPVEKFDLNYLAYVLRADSFRKEMAFLAQGISRYNISKNKVMDVEIPVPILAEQSKVGQYFRNLDHLITLHQRKYDKLTKVKKSMLEKMFPKNGANVPEIRFKGFTDAWEQRKVSEIAIEKLSNGIMNNQSDDETGVKHINVINMYDTDKIHPEKLTFSNYDEEAVKKCNVEFGDIFLTRSSLKPEGIAEANVLLDSGHFVYDDHLIRLKVNKEKYDPFFVKLNLSGNAFKRQFIVRAKTTAFTTIGQEDISECLGFFPKKEEQQQIGEYFMTLDHLITLHQRELEKLKILKKACLGKMFV